LDLSRTSTLVFAFRFSSALITLDIDTGLVSANRTRYQESKVQLGKWDVTMGIVEAVLKEGRFLKPCQGGRAWSVLSLESARQKVAHAIQYQNRRRSAPPRRYGSNEYDDDDEEAVSSRNPFEGTTTEAVGGSEGAANAWTMQAAKRAMLLSQLAAMDPALETQQQQQQPMLSAREMQLQQLAALQSREAQLFMSADASAAAATQAMNRLRSELEGTQTDIMASYGGTSVPAMVTPNAKKGMLSWDRMEDAASSSTSWDGAAPDQRDSYLADDDYAMTYRTQNSELDGARVSPEDSNRTTLTTEGVARLGGYRGPLTLDYLAERSYLASSGGDGAQPHFVTPTRTPPELDRWNRPAQDSLAANDNNSNNTTRLALEQELALASQSQNNPLLWQRRMSMPAMATRPASPHLQFLRGNGTDIAQEPSAAAAARHYLSSLYAPDLSSPMACTTAGMEDQDNVPFGSAQGGELDDFSRSASMQGQRRYTMPHGRSNYMAPPVTPPRSILEAQRNAMSMPSFGMQSAVPDQDEVTRLIEEYQSRAGSICYEADLNRRIMNSMAAMNNPTVHGNNGMDPISDLHSSAFHSTAEMEGNGMGQGISSEAANVPEVFHHLRSSLATSSQSSRMALLQHLQQQQATSEPIRGGNHGGDAAQAEGDHWYTSMLEQS
jgi:hypothetical protein